ncbi:MAG: IS66 family transposase [Bacteroidota bacterium]
MAQQKQIALLLDEVSKLKEQVSNLQEQINKNSRNSNKPPSSDGLKKPPKPQPAFPRKKGKKSGGQPGHKGKTLEIVAVPDYTNQLLPSHCDCGHPLDKSKAELLEIRQVFDIPIPKLEVTEHQKMGCTCPSCKRYNQGQFPPEVKARVQYGVGVQALVVLLNVAFKLPLKKIQTLFGDLYGYSINQSTIIKATKRCFTHLETSEKTIRQQILASIVAHFDETGLRVKGKLHWLHTACTKMYTYLFIHAKRGKKALWDVDSILPDFKNWAMHDCWSSYFKFTDCTHAICGAHLLRELTALIEKNIKWAALFKTYLLALYHLSDKGTTQLNPQEQQRALLLFEQIWKVGDLEEPPAQKSASGRGKPKGTKGRNLLTRLKKHQTAVLAFAFNEAVPFTNNHAERDLRPAKTKQKVAGSFRTLEGAKIYTRILGFVSTARKHQRSVFKELKIAFSGKTFLTEGHPS